MRQFGFFLAFVVVLPVAALCAPAHAVLTFLDVPGSAQPTPVAVDSAGNLFIAANVVEPSGRQQLRIIKTDPHGNTLASVSFGGSGSDAISAAATDPDGNLVLTGSTNSPDFPLVSPLISKTSRNSAFLVKFDSTLHNILFSTLLGGTQGGGEGTSGPALTLDANGNFYLTGSTDDTDFPFTAQAFQTQPPVAPGDIFGYVTEISSDGKRIVFSTYYGADHVTCLGPGPCFGITRPVAIALDSADNVVVAGTTNSDRLPVTPGVFGPNCGECSSLLFTSFMAKFAPGGSKLLWATYIPVPASTLTGIQVQAMALDSSANVLIGGSTSGGPVPVGAVQATLPGTGIAGFVTKLDSNAQQILFSTYFGGGIGQEVTGITLDTSGTIWLTGISSPDDLPVLKGIPLLGPDYVASLEPDGSAVTNMFTTPEGGAGRAILSSATGTLIAVGGTDSLLTVSAGAGPSLLAITNSAGLDTAAAVAPDELISIYGIGLGPSTSASAQILKGDAPTSLNGVQVLFDGGAASLLYVGPNQINAIVPQEVFGRATTALQIVTPSETISGPNIPVRPSQPEVFLSNLPSQGTYPLAAAVNQDGTLNSAANPAAAGSIVSVWVSGAGLEGLPVAVLQLIRTGAVEQVGYSLEVLFAGQAPGLVDGVTQINFRLPSADQASEFQLQIGDALSDPFVLYTKL